jgi:hypothetical protein
MADFTPKKLSTEKGSAEGGIGKPPGGAEHMAPPRIYLEHHHLEKLGMAKMPAVGSKIHISGLAHVGATSEHDHSDQPGEKKRRSMTLHLHKMEMGTNGPGKEVDQEAETAKSAKAEMDKALKRAAGGKHSKGSEGEESGEGMTPRAGGD